MSYIKNRIIHRFIRDIADYELGGACYSQILPADTQVYAVYPDAESTDVYGEKSGLYYVIGDGIHTYTEIRDGRGSAPYNIEYRAVPAGALDALLAIFSNIKITDLKDGDYLVYDAKQKCWVNRGGTPGPEPTEDIDGGSASDIPTSTIDGGNAWTIDFDIIIDGGNAGEQPEPPEDIDGGDASSIPVYVVDGGNAGSIADETIDGGNAGTPIPTEDVDGGDNPAIDPTSVLDAGLVDSAFDKVIDGGDPGVIESVDGGDTPSSIITDTIDGASPVQAIFDRILDGGTI